MTKAIEKSILADINAMEAEFEIIRQKYQKNAQTKIKELFAEIFVEFPEMKMVWQQFTPNWNDGEECTFRVSDIGLTNIDAERFEELTDEAAVEWDRDDDDVYDGHGDFIPDPNFVPGVDQWGHKKYHPNVEINKEQNRLRPYFWINETYANVADTMPTYFFDKDTKKLKEFLTLIGSGKFSTIMEQTFGNGSYVIASAEGFDAREYDAPY